MAGEPPSATAGQLPELFTAAQWWALIARLRLSDRQGEIARLVCHGLTNDQIAHRLGISPNTVRMHLKALFERLEIHDRVGVVVRLVLAAQADSRVAYPA